MKKIIVEAKTATLTKEEYQALRGNKFSVICIESVIGEATYFKKGKKYDVTDTYTEAYATDEIGEQHYLYVYEEDGEGLEVIKEDQEWFDKHFQRI